MGQDFFDIDYIRVIYKRVSNVYTKHSKMNTKYEENFVAIFHLTFFSCSHCSHMKVFLTCLLETWYFNDWSIVAKINFQEIKYG